MSDFSQIIVDVEVEPLQAARYAADIRRWLISQGIIQADATDSALGEMAHRPGPNFRKAIQTEETAFLWLWTNGVAIVTGGRVFDAGGNGIELRRDCDGVIEDFDPSFLDAVAACHGGDDRASFSCPQCQQPRLLTDWRRAFQWGFGHLGLEFWKWPPLSEKFVQAINRRLGRRTVLVYRHI